MRGSARRLLSAAVLLAIGAACCGPGEARASELRAPRPGKIYTWTFDADTLEHAPAHSHVLGGVWIVLPDSADSARPAAVAAAADSARPAAVATPADSARPAAVATPADSARPRGRVIRQTEDADGVAYHYLIFT